MTARTPTPSSSITRGAIHSTRDSTTLNFIEMSFVSANNLIRKCVGVIFAIKLRVIFLFIFFRQNSFFDTHRLIYLQEFELCTEEANQLRLIYREGDFFFFEKLYRLYRYFKYP